MPMEAVSPSPLTPSAISFVIGQHSAGGDRGHAAVNRVEAVRAAHEICRAFGRASNAAGLDHALRLDAHFVHGVDDALGDCVVAAAGAQRGLAAAVVENGQANAVGLRCGRGCGSAGGGRHLFALHGHEFVGDRARVERQAVNVRDAARARVTSSGLMSSLSSAEHLGIAVLLDHINPLVLFHEFVHFARKRIGFQAKIIGFDVVFLRVTGRGLRQSPSGTCHTR